MNKYVEIILSLEKEAENRLMRHLRETNAPGINTINKKTGHKFGSSDATRQFTGAVQANRSNVGVGGTAHVPGTPGKRGFLGLGSKPAVAASDVPNTATRKTFDTLAGSTAKGRLTAQRAGNTASVVTGQARPAKPAVTGLVNKALDLAKKNPKTALAAGAIGAIGLGRSLGNNGHQNNGY